MNLLQSLLINIVLLAQMSLCAFLLFYGIYHFNVLMHYRGPSVRKFASHALKGSLSCGLALLAIVTQAAVLVNSLGGVGV